MFVLSWISSSKPLPFKSFMFPHILPFYGKVSFDTERMEIPTISANVQEPSNPIQKPGTHEHVTFSTGLLTILIFTACVIIYSFAQYFAFQMSSSSQGYIITLVLTTIIPISWTLANSDLKGFALRTIKNLLSCGN